MSIYILATRDEDSYDFYSSFLFVSVFSSWLVVCVCAVVHCFSFLNSCLYLILDFLLILIYVFSV